MINTEYISKNFEILLSNIKEYNNQVKELIELFSKSKNECNEIINNDIERSKNILDDYNDFVDKINNLQKFEIEKFVSNMINLKIAETDSDKYYENLFISNNIDQNDKNLFDNLPVITKYKTINNSSIIQEKYDNIIDIYKINRHVMKNLFAFNFILSYTQKNDIQEDKNIIKKYYKGTLIIDNVIDNPEVKAFITIPDNEILGFENKSIGPEFEIEFKYDDNNIYIMFKHTKIFRFDINENNELVDIFSDSFYKSKEIYYNIDLAFYSVDESLYIETVENETEFENREEIPYSKITLKPIKEGFYKYINFDIDSKNIINKNASRKYLFNSHELDKSENIEKNEYFDINKFVDFIENEFNREVEKYEFQTDEYVLKINDSYSDGDKIIFATNKGLFVYLLEDNNYLNISKKWMNVYDNKIINIDYRCIGKNSNGTYYTYTNESGLISLGKNIFKYIDGSIPIDIKNIPSNNILDILTASDIIDVKIKNDLIYLYSVSHVQENANYKIDILDFNLNRVYTKPGDYRYDSIAFDKNTYFFTNIDLKDFLKENNLLFKKEGDNIVIFENCFIDNNIIHYEDVEPKILNIDFDQYNFSINSPFYFDEIGDKIYCIFEDNEGKIKSLEIIKNDEQYIATNEVYKISDGSIFKTIDNLYFRKDNITIVNNVGIIKTNKNKIVKIDNIKNIRDKINNILNKEIEDDNLDENVNLFYKILIYAKNKVNYSDSFDGLYKEFGIINRKDTDFDIIRTDIGTFLKEKDRDDVYYWAANGDKYEKLGNKKDRYENIRFEYINKIPKYKIEYSELDKIINGRVRLPLADIPTDSNYKNGNNSSTPFYNNAHGFKVVSIKKRCTKMSFYYKVSNPYNSSSNIICLYIDGIYKNNYYNRSWTQGIIDNLTDEEHEFTWVLYNNNRYYSCIDTIAFNDIVETDSSKFSNTYEKELKNINNNYKNGANSSTPFYNDASGIKVVSIKKRCTKMSFYYKVKNSSSDYNSIYLYIDGVYRNKYYNTSWEQITISNLTDEEHEFTWVLYNYNSNYSCIDTIAFNDIVETDSNKFSNTYEKELKNIYINNNCINGQLSTTPFFNDTIGIKVVSIEKQCTKMSFYYKVYSSNSKNNIVYLYIDGIYKSSYAGTSWMQITINNLTDKEHEFTWVLYSYDNGWYSCIDTISFNDIVETDSSKFSNNGNMPLADIPTDSNYKNGNSSSTPFYNNTIGIKVVSIKKQCTKMSFYYKVKNSSSIYNFIYLYIDGKYKNKYYNTSWTQAIINNLTNEEHEFTWVLYSYSDGYYSCIDTIAFNDIVEKDSNKFSNTYEKELKNINNNYKNGNSSSTPFYNDTAGIKVVSIKKRCTKMSFYYKTIGSNDYNNSVYLYIDGIYKSSYAYTSWTQAIINNLTNEEHEFTWVLYNYDNSYYSCIDTIAFNDIVETNSSKFSNTYEKELKYINDNYKNGQLSATPFYNDTASIKVVSIKKQCTKMSFYYRVSYHSSTYSFIYLYIDGIYKSRYNNDDTLWRRAIINNLTNKEHEFTWVLYSYSDGYYSCIDTIAFNDIVEKDSNKFSNTYEKELYIYDTYKNGTDSSTPFYNDTAGIKVVSIKKRCTKMSFYYKVYSSTYRYNSVYLYIDGAYRNIYTNTSWTQITINNLMDEEHEFTWVLYSYSNDYYSCIDTIAFNDIVETDSSKFNNNGNIQLANIPTDSNYKNGTNSSTPFYNNTSGIKVVFIKKQCTKMSFYYKINRNGYEYNSIYLYIDGVYRNIYYDTSWTQAIIDNLSDKEHEFTWVLYSHNDNYSCIDTIAFNDIVFNYEVEDNNNIIDTLTNNKIKGNIDGFVTNLSYSENEIEFDYKININNVKNIFTNKNKTLIMTENKLYSSFDKILSPINKKYIPNAVSSLTNNMERTNYLKEISTYINISNIKTIKLSECCIYILTNDNKLYMCGNNILFEIPNIEQDKIINDFEKIFDNVSNIWVSDNSNIIEITKNNVKEYYISGKNNYNKYNISDKYINNYKDENLSSINNIKEIKIFENYIFVITDDNKIYARGRNDNNIGITDMQTIFNSLQLVFENNDITEIIDIKSNKLYSIIHCKDLDKKDVYYFSGKIDDNSKKEFTKIIFNSSNDITKDVFIFDDNEYITYFIDENEVMYISNSLDKNNKLEIEYPIEKALKANNEYYLLMNSNIYIYKPLNNKLIRVIDKVYDFFVFEDSMLRIIRTDMSYGTLFLDNFKFDKEYNYGAGVYIGPNIKREHIRKIKYEINSDYMEAYYGFNYNKFGENKIYSYIYDLNNNRNKRRISDFKENSDVFGIRKRRVTNTILDNLELLDSEESEKMYSVIFELLPINPNKVLTDTVFVNDIHSDNEIKIESIVK